MDTNANRLFSEMLKNLRKNYPIFQYSGTKVNSEITAQWGATSRPNHYLFEERLETITAIAKAKALKYRYEKEEQTVLSFEKLIIELCPENISLAKDTHYILEKAIKLDNITRKYNSDWARISINEESINALMTGPIYYGADYDEFIASAVDFKSKEIQKRFLEEISIYFNDIIDFKNIKEIEIKDKSLESLNQAIIHKSKVLDVIELPEGGLFICVDVNKRFQDGDIISTTSASMLSLEYSLLNFIVIP
mgnify:CR=1 FL=1